MALSTYQILPQNITETGIKYFFVSKGHNDIIKAVEYFYFTDYNDRRVYNLGFGDYVIEKDEIDDNINTDNGDAYYVFNTVLNTVPEFFKSFADAAVIVRGSDSSNEFEENCKKTCKRNNCEAICRKRHQRIRAYCSYVSREYDALTQTYDFFGGFETEDGTVIEHFMKNKVYQSVLILRK